jgi:hypothetical protein
MKYLLLLAAIIPTFSWAMENEKPIIKMEHEEFLTLLNKYWDSKDRWSRKFSHTIDIPESEKGTIFELSTNEGFHPKKINLELEKETKSITITKDYADFHITNDTHAKLATFHMLMNSD